MELNSDLTSLQSLPLDTGLFALRRPPTPAGDDGSAFRQHLQTPRGREDKEPDAPPEAETKNTPGRSRQERPDRPAKPREANRSSSPKRNEAPASEDSAAPASDAPADAQKLDDVTDVEASAAEVQESANADDPSEDTAAESAEQIIAEATSVIVAAVAIPAELTTSLVDETTVEAPAIEPASQATPNAPAHQDLPNRPVEVPVEVAADATEAVQDSETEQVAATETKQELNDVKPVVETKPDDAPLKIKPEARESVEELTPTTEKDDSTKTTSADKPHESLAPQASEKEASGDDSDGHRPRKDQTAKAATTISDQVAPSAEPADTKQAAPVHTTHTMAQPISAPVAVTAVAEKVAASSSQSASAPRGIGAIESAAPQRLPQHLVGKLAQPDSGEPRLTEAEQVRLLQRVARAFQTAQQREGEVRIRLSPPELGAMKLEIKVQDGVMSAKVETETQAAQSILIDNLPALRERLAEQNIRLEQFDVNLPGRQSQGEQDSRDARPQGGSRPAFAGREASGAAESTGPVARHHDGKLNVFI